MKTLIIRAMIMAMLSARQVRTFVHLILFTTFVKNFNSKTVNLSQKVGREMSVTFRFVGKVVILCKDIVNVPANVDVI